jgi:hypothetical protein
MAKKARAPRHWPFVEGAVESDASKAFRAALERKNARVSAQASHQERARSNRLIVGGRAHTKQHGLS